MPQPTNPSCPLALPLPSDPAERVLLALFRRMAIHGLHDASATMLALNHFGPGFRKPLSLLRCFVHDLSASANRTIRLAPCCAPRMTMDEALMVDVVMLGDLASLEALTESDDPMRTQAIADSLREEFQLLARRFARSARSG